MSKADAKAEPLLSPKKRQPFPATLTEHVQPFLDQVDQDRKKLTTEATVSRLDHTEEDDAAHPIFILKWLCPFFLNMVALLFCSFCLHIATWKYVTKMSNLELQMNQLNVSGDALSSTWAVLPDMVEVAIPRHSIDVASFDHAAILVPLLWGVGTIFTQDLHLWTKVLISSSLFATWKGILSVITVMPDSSGWAGCKARLSERRVDGVRFFTQDVRENLVLWDILSMQFFGSHHDRLGPDLRYCTGSLFSPQYVLFNWSGLYALAFFELVRRQSMLNKKHYSRGSRRCLLITLAVILTSLQVAEISLSVLNRSHYSSEIFTTYILTFLCYTNGSLTVAIKWWKRFGEDQNVLWTEGPRASGDYVEFPVRCEEVRDVGDLWVPVCCFPFCLFDGHHHMFRSENVVRIPTFEKHDDGTFKRRVSPGGTKPRENKGPDLSSPKTRSLPVREDHSESLKEELQRLRDSEAKLQKENRLLRQENTELRGVLQLALPTV